MILVVRDRDDRKVSLVTNAQNEPRADGTLQVHLLVESRSCRTILSTFLNLTRQDRQLLVAALQEADGG